MPLAGLPHFTLSSIISRFSTRFKLLFHTPHTTSATMARKFFVGGNFKMNPVSREAKKGLVNALNEASLDPNVGEYRCIIAVIRIHPESLLSLVCYAKCRRGHRSSYHLPYSYRGACAQRYSGRRAKLLRQAQRCFHRRDQVRIPDTEPITTVLNDIVQPCSARRREDPLCHPGWAPLPSPHSLPLLIISAERPL